MKNAPTQEQRILDYLRSGKELTRLNAWDDLGVIECPARITELRAKGHDIKTKMIVVKNRYGDKVKIAKWSMK